MAVASIRSFRDVAAFEAGECVSVRKEVSFESGTGARYFYLKDKQENVAKRQTDCLVAWHFVTGYPTSRVVKH